MKEVLILLFFLAERWLPVGPACDGIRPEGLISVRKEARLCCLHYPPLKYLSKIVLAWVLLARIVMATRAAGRGSWLLRHSWLKPAALQG